MRLGWRTVSTHFTAELQCPAEEHNCQSQLHAPLTLVLCCRSLSARALGMVCNEKNRKKNLFSLPSRVLPSLTPKLATICRGTAVGTSIALRCSWVYDASNVARKKTT